jgi:hypothetical protein
VIHNIISKHTNYSVDEYSGASLQSLLTHNNTKLTYKLTMFFGYSSSRNSISHSIEITEKQYLSLISEINTKNKKIIIDCKSILSDEELYGVEDFVRTTSRTLNDPTLLTTLNTTTKETKKSKKKITLETWKPNDRCFETVQKKYPKSTTIQIDELIIDFRLQAANRETPFKDFNAGFQNYVRKGFIEIKQMSNGKYWKNAI